MATSVFGLGFVDGSSYYEVLTDAGAIALLGKRGNPLSNETSPFWDIVEVVSIEQETPSEEATSRYLALLEGTVGTKKEGNYQVYEFDSAGQLAQEIDPWRTGKKMTKLGYEEIFDIDINGNSIIGKTSSTLKPDVDGFKVVPKGELISVDDDDLGGTTPPAFSVKGGSKKKKDVQISFMAVSRQDKLLDLEIPTKTGTIASAAPQVMNLKIDGVYYNSAAGSDNITGSSFNDFLRGGAGDDLIDCGAGDDVVRIGAGNDRLTLGTGADTLYLTADQLQGSENVLVDFKADEDQVVIDAQLEPYISIEDVEGGVSINLSGPKNMVGKGGITQLLNDALMSEAISFG